ncbi:type I-F CRISPR-associated helicase Cas3f [Pantoea sp. 18069]|uniref:type I-F CRISPR-associated helicase Cas3f n=1 Tax=Pantoea sp. 18069 TaxID=2681415 RepID=UPI00135806EB|nr:type I-F CRISPR-associated helicase Cas3f [Pantoea sp. 18069]
MNILLISECDKRALVETRRILDQFAERRGERTWQTPITKEGLDTLRRLLRKTARKNTAVACHWIRGLDHSELLWVVGDARRFNARGAVPTHTTQRNVLRKQDENDWHSGEAIHLFAALAALLHDLGKASQAFQDRLRNKGEMGRNDYRHEWVSLRMFQAFVGTDTDAQWLARLAEPTPADHATWTDRLVRDGLDTPAPPPFMALAHAPLAQAIGWLVVTHHRLPQPPKDEVFNPSHLAQVLHRITAPWNEIPTHSEARWVKPYWSFTPKDLPIHCPTWQKNAAKLSRRLQVLLAQPGQGDWLANPYVMHVSRMCLMLADHHYSSLETKDDGRIDVPAWGTLAANTKRQPDGTNGKNPELLQPLNEHLIGVAKHSQLATRALPGFELHLPRMTGHRLLRQRSTHSAFRWQDKAADLASAQREQAATHGAFIVNMASTGCGKTLANAKVMHALADPVHGMRCSFAMGLRTLTLQTGRAFRNLLQLDDEQLAILVGGAASRTLFEHYAAQAEASGSASRQDLVDEFAQVEGIEGNADAHPLLSRVTRDAKVRQLLTAPLLVCTIDHLVPATESQRGGRQIAPMLRLMSSDLVLDEPDDFDLGDLPALGRLVHWAGLLGARVLLSSATLAPALVQGLFEAYLAGRREYAKNRGAQPGSAVLPDVCCLWLDEYDQRHANCASADAFMAQHISYVQGRSHRLANVAEVRRRAALLPLQIANAQDADARHAGFAQAVLAAAMAQHAHHHSVDPHSGKRISFGLVRMANIEPLVEVALALFRQGVAAGWQVHLCVYHARFPLLLRSAIEQRLDAVLNRRTPHAVFDRSDLRQCIDAHASADQMFIVLGSPVTEVGRDHDYDWAVVEPSSMRSLIQLAGRVRRHRTGACMQPNIAVLDTNLRHFQSPAAAAFRWPGFEDGEAFLLVSHRLGELLHPHEIEDLNAIDARPRIQSPLPAQLQPQRYWVDLEHARLRQTLLRAAPPAATTALHGRAPMRGAARQPPAESLFNGATWWLAPPQDALLTHVLPQRQRFRQQTREQVDVMLLLNEDEDGVELHLALEWVKRSAGPRSINITRERMELLDDRLVQGERIAVWGTFDYMRAVSELAQSLGISPVACAQRYGTTALPVSSDDWCVRFHPALGFTSGQA